MKEETASVRESGIRPVEGLENNYLILDRFGNEHEMVEIKAFEWNANKGMGFGFVHPAFRVNDQAKYEGHRVFVGKYQASVVDGKYVTRKDGVVAHSINFDKANQICNDLNDGTKITGFHLMTNAEWAAVAMMSHEVMKGERVQGNNRSGKDYTSDKIMGTPETGKKNFDEWPARWLAGSGGVKTSHNGNESGIYDLNGNVFEWVKGLRLMNGEIQIIPDNNAAVFTIDVAEDSPEWKAILEDGSIVEPGTEGTLKFNTDGNISKTTEHRWDGKKFKTIKCADDVNPDSIGVELLKKLLVFPFKDDLHEDYFWYDNSGENMPLRGGNWGSGDYAGLFYLYLDDTRALEDDGLGFRVAFVL